MSAEPSISVIAPAWNATSFYDAWLGSIQAQNYPNLEVILVDDGSTDDLCARARNGPPYLRCLSQNNRGPAAARNKGIAASTGDFVAFLDLDDLWTPGHLQRMAAALAEHPDHGIAQGLIRNFCYGEDGRAYYCSRAYRFINLGSAVFRRSVFEECGVFAENMRFAEDFDFLIRCWEQGVRKLELARLSLSYHRHPGNMTHGKTVVEMGGVAIYKRHLERLRAGKVKADMRERCAVGYPEYIGNNVFPFDEGIRELVG
jgi:glycosyltransferase involved in cell wall biosynthesis